MDAANGRLTIQMTRMNRTAKVNIKREALGKDNLKPLFI